MLIYRKLFGVSHSNLAVKIRALADFFFFFSLIELAVFVYFSLKISRHGVSESIFIVRTYYSNNSPIVTQRKFATEFKLKIRGPSVPTIHRWKHWNFDFSVSDSFTGLPNSEVKCFTACKIFIHSGISANFGPQHFVVYCILPMFFFQVLKTSVLANIISFASTKDWAFCAPKSPSDGRASTGILSLLSVNLYRYFHHFLRHWWHLLSPQFSISHSQAWTVQIQEKWRLWGDYTFSPIGRFRSP